MASVCMRRLRRELVAINREPDPDIRVATEPDTLLVWHFLLKGVEGTPYSGGEYWGRINFPESFPVQPPSVVFFTPNGRFETGKRLCLHGVSDYHGEDWNPKTTVLGLLQSIRFAMRDEGIGIGSMRETVTRRRDLASKSTQYNCRDPKYKVLFGEEEAGAAAAGAAVIDSDNAVKAQDVQGTARQNSNEIKDQGNAGAENRESLGTVDRLKSASTSKRCLPSGKFPSDIMNLPTDIERIMVAAQQGDLLTLDQITSRMPLAVHAIRHDGKTPAIMAGLAKNAGALIFLVERGAAFKHHGPEPEYKGHHVNSLLGCEAQLNRLAVLAGCCCGADHQMERWQLIEAVYLSLDKLGWNEPILRPVPSKPVVRVTYLLAETRMQSCTLFQQILRIRIIMDIMLTCDGEVRTFIDQNGVVLLSQMLRDLQSHVNEFTNKGISSVDDLDEDMIIDEACVSNGLYFISRVLLFVCLAAAAEKRRGSSERWKKLRLHGTCNVLLDVLKCRIDLSNASIDPATGPAIAPPAAKTTAFTCQSLTEMTFEVDSTSTFDAATYRDIIVRLTQMFKHDKGCAEMLSWWTCNLILHDVFSVLPEQNSWAIVVATDILERHPNLERAKRLLSCATGSCRGVNVQRAACEGNLEKLLEAIEADPVGIHRADAITGQTPLMAAANTGNASVCDVMLTLIEHAAALKYHANPPNRGRHHVDKFVQHAKHVELLANMAEIGYEENMPVNPRCCPAGHELKRFVTSTQGFMCDCCNARVPVGTTLYGCQNACDGGYDECQMCYSVFTAPLEKRLKMRNELVDNMRMMCPPPRLPAERLNIFRQGVSKYQRSIVLSEDSCFMCGERLADLPEDEVVTLGDDCGHQHHWPCLSQWLTGNRGSCPTCDKGLAIAWQDRPRPPASPMSPTADAIKLLTAGIMATGSPDRQHSASMGARILADQALSSSRRARQVLGSGAISLMSSACDIFKQAPEVLYNIGLVLLEVAIALKTYISVDTIDREFLPILIKILNACVAVGESRRVSGTNWPVVAEVACQTIAELSLGASFSRCHQVLLKHNLVPSVLHVIKLEVYHSHAEVMRMVWILFSNMVQYGGSIASMCTAHCAGLLYWQIWQQELVPQLWLDPLKEVAGPCLDSWEDSTDASRAYRAQDVENDSLERIRVALGLGRIDSSSAINEID